MTRILVLIAGPALQLLTLLAAAPAGIAGPAWHVAGLAGWMALWWVTTVIPLEATALLPLFVLPLTTGRPLDAVAAPYADPVIFLFLGGFFIAAALERWNLHRRLATATLRVVGTSPRRIVLAFLLATAFVSMWISNTAAAVMMLPIATAAAGLADAGPEGAALPRSFIVALLLAVAYGASIGGVATLIGSPPNAIFAANARTLVGVEVSFADWLPVGLAVAVPLMFACWGILVTVFRVPAGARPGNGPPDRQTARPPDAGEWFVLGVFALAALAWIFREPKDVGLLRLPGLTDLVPGLGDAGIAIGAALLLFAVPLPRARHRFALDWETARKVPWGVLLLFGGGLALAGAAQESGLAQWIGGRLEGLRGLPLPLVIAATALLFALLTELTSNTAIAALGMPLMAGVAQGLGQPPVPLMMAAALASSMAFMLPVSTPPNAIVFGHGSLRVTDMVKAGVLLDLVAIIVITVVVSLWAL
jgi:sodium-dependent dicarboxylate transporter 2/3/5